MENTAESIILSSRRKDLDSESPSILQPNNLNAILKPHQLSSMYRCVEYETKHIEIDNNCNSSAKIKTRLGIIADKVGSGKSYIVLGLIMNDLSQDVLTNESQQLTSSFAFDNIQITYEEKSVFSNVNVIVIPHNLIKQWSTYCDTILQNVKYTMVSTTKQLLALHDKDLKQFTVIVVSSTFHNSFSQMCRNNHMCFKRVFYDEADSIPIRSCDKLLAKFTWFVTASYKNLMYPRGHGMWDHTLHRFVTVAYGIKSTGYIRTLFSGMNAQLVSLLIVKNSDAFVDSAMQLPAVEPHIVLCRTPRAITILEGLVDRNIIRALNANDVEGAIQHINPSNRSSEDNIIAILLEKYERTLQNAKIMMRMVKEELVYETEAIREIEFNKAKKTYDEYTEKINDVINRIKNTNTCCICYDIITAKTVLDCCQNAFCFKCLTLWLNTKHTCPSCRSTVSTSNMFVVAKSNSENNTQADDMIDINETRPHLSDNNDKFKNLQILLQEKMEESSKVLIFSCYDSTFEKTEELLRKLHLNFALLKGSHDVIASVVDRYKKGNLNILLVNPRNYGSGLNLENTTDIIVLHKFDNEIEQQVIGRAQRLGRTAPLKVWYLLYENEATVTNI